MKWMVLIFVSLMTATVFIAIRNQRAWHKYRTEHHCHGIGVRVGQLVIGTTYDANGKVLSTVTQQPDQTIYACDGGEIRIR